MTSLIPEDIIYNCYISVVCPKHGAFKVSAANHLKGSGCPACRESRAEKRIRKLLTDWKIEFYSQYIFKDCRYITSLRFDFFLPKYNLAIEYQGQQHYSPTEIFGGQKEYEKVVIRDNIKKEYCLNNNIRFEEIRFDQSIEKRLLEILN